MKENTIMATPRNSFASRGIVGLVLIGLIGVMLAAPAPLAAQLAGITFANPAFQGQWARYDYPVVQRQTNRSWTFGPTSNGILNEQYVESPGGQRQVQYFDKARMELNDPANPGGVTYGLIVREMVGGFVATGNAATQPSTPAQVPVAGDPAEANPNAPTYASFTNVASINGRSTVGDRTGQAVNDTIAKSGATGTVIGNLNRYVYYEPTLGHNIPQMFWDFLNQSGTIYYSADGQFGQASVYDPWYAVMGLPITEAFIIQTNVGGTPMSVIVQLFERRVLTYTMYPSGPLVEMGNVGQHYQAWRYTSPPPAPTAVPNQPAFTFGPQHGTITNVTADLVWQTNVPTSSQVDWGTDPDNLTQRAGSTGFATNHRVQLTGLTPGGTYYWRVNARVEGGGQLRSDWHSFQTTTPALPPTPTPTTPPNQPTPTPDPARTPLISSGPTVVNLTATQATIVWNTDIPTNTELIWGTSQDQLNQRVNLSDMTPDHAVTMTPLRPATTYYYRTEGRAQSGKGVSSAILSFRTPSQ